MEHATVEKVMNILYNTYPEAKCELVHNNPFELLVATILSAQTTDKKVNEVTRRLFLKNKTPYDFLKLTSDELEKEIKEIGLYKNKSKNIINMCRTLTKEYNGEVPNTKEELLKLSGVGTKTANVVLSNAFNIPEFAVDTHVFRVSNRIGLAKAKNVEETEKQLRSNVKKEHWIKAHHTLIFHGRQTCTARQPKCSICNVNLYCEYYKESKK